MPNTQTQILHYYFQKTHDEEKKKMKRGKENIGAKEKAARDHEFCLVYLRTDKTSRLDTLSIQSSKTTVGN